jgi:PAS domain S-box-containing protein
VLVDEEPESAGWDAPPEPAPGQLISPPLWMLFAAVAALYAIGSGSALAMARWSGLSAVLFIPAGLVVGVLLRTPKASWWVTLAAAGLAEATLDLAFGLTVSATIGFVVANTAGPLVGAIIVQGRCGRVDLSRRTHVWWFIIGAVVSGPAVGALVGAVSDGLFEGDAVVETFLQWWLGDAVGVALVGGAILAWGSSPDRRSVASPVGAAHLVGTVALTTLTFGATDLPIGFLVLVGIVIAGAIFGPRAVAFTGLVIAGTILAVRMQASSPLVAGVDEATALLVIKSQLGMFSVAGMVVAAEVSERELATRRAERFRVRTVLYEAERRQRERTNTLAEQALRSEERYRALLEQTEDGVFQIDQGRRILEAGPAGADMLGYEPQHVVGLVFDELFHPDDRDRCVAEITDVAEGEVLRTEWRLLRSDRSLLVAGVVGTQSGDGRIQLIVNDVTARNQLWDALRSSEARFHSLFSSIDEGYCVAEMVVDDTGAAIDYRFVVTNGQFETMTGLADAVGRTARELVPELESSWVETYARVALEGETLRFENHSQALGRWFDVFAAPVEPFGSFALVFNDITARRLAEKALRESEERFRGLADHLPHMIWEHDASGRQVFVNETFCSYFGVSRHDMAGDRWADLVHPADLEAYAAAFAESVEKATPFHAEVRITRPDGELRWLESWAQPTWGPSGEFLGLVGTSVDVTDRKRAEDESRAAKEMAQRSRGRLEFIAGLLTDLESVTGVEARSRMLVESLVPRVADYATVEDPSSTEPLVAWAHVDPAMRPVLAELRRRHRLQSDDAYSLYRVAGGEEHLIASVAPAFRSEFAVDPTTAALLAELAPLSHLAVPLDLGGTARGALMLGLSDVDRRPYSEGDLTFVRDIADRAGRLLANARLAEHEHAVALRLQQALLPDALLSHAAVELAARYHAAAHGLEVGGDWYESFQLDDGRIGVAVGDVVGHGLDSAVAMGRLRSAMGAMAPRCGGPGRLLTDLDAGAAASPASDFATACTAVLDPESGRLTYASAGHPPILVVTADGVPRWLSDGRSPPLGTMASGERPEASVTVTPGSVVVLYSDGLVERRREPLDAGLARLEEAVTKHRFAAAADLCDLVIAEMTEGSGFEDDVVVVCMRVGAGLGPLIVRLPAHPDQLARLRSEMRVWLGRWGVDESAGRDLLLAVGEAASNTVEHAYPPDSPGEVSVELSLHPDGYIAATVRDQGRWRHGGADDGDHRGRGLAIMGEIAFDLDCSTGPDGTVTSFKVAHVAAAAVAAGPVPGFETGTVDNTSG